ncbi:MAG: V-type ATP synthase subunit D [Candidatus Bathyarchaeia archaeon]
MSTELIPGVHATRFELLMLKRRLRLAQRGHDLLVEKRDALLLHFFNFIRDISPLRAKLNKALEEAYMNFLRTQISLGTGKLEGVALTVPDRFEVNEKTRNIIGVTLPILELNVKQKPESGWWYNLPETPAALDEAVLSFEKVLRMVVELAETETAVKRLAEAITMTKRRVNALESILIPRFQNTIRFIQLSLEERAREDFFRLKRIKKLHEEAETESALALA